MLSQRRRTRLLGCGSGQHLLMGVLSAACMILRVTPAIKVERISDLIGHICCYCNG